MQDIQIYDKGRIVIGLNKERTGLMVNGNLTFNYNNYTLIYAAEPLLPFDPYAEKYIGDPNPFNFLICTVNEDTWVDNKCFLFTNVEMNDVVEKGLLTYLAESFTIGQRQV